MNRDHNVALVTSDGRGNDRSALATVRALGAAGWTTIVVTSRSDSLAAASRWCRGVVRCTDDWEAAAPTVREVAADRRAVRLFATSDAALSVFSPETDLLMSKLGLRQAADSVGLATPGGASFESRSELERTAASIGFPLVVKPVRKVPGGPTTALVRDRGALEELRLDAGIAQPYLSGPTTAISGVAWSGSIVVALQQRYVRTFPVEAGTASFAFTEPVDRSQLGKLAQLLASHNGIFQAQFVGGKLIDVNLRPYGSMPLAVSAGLNLPDIVCRLAAGRVVPPVEPALGVRYRWLEGDIRGLTTRLRGGELSLLETLVAASPRRFTTHSVVSWRDFRPAFVRLRRILSKAA